LPLTEAVFIIGLIHLTDWAFNNQIVRPNLRSTKEDKVMKMKTTAMVLALMCNPVGAQSDYIDGEFEGRMGWMPNSGGSPEYYLGYSDGREEHEDIGDLLREMYEESDRERRHDELMDALEELADD
jgi:hypothetical protein